MKYGTICDRFSFLNITNSAKIEGVINELGLFFKFTNTPYNFCLNGLGRDYLDLGLVNKLLSPYGVVVREDGASCTHITYYKDSRVMAEVERASVISKNIKVMSRTI